MSVRPPNVAGYAHANWHVPDGAPPVIVNPKAPLRTLLAWCWGEAGCIYALMSEIQCGPAGAMDSISLAGALARRTHGLREMLEYICSVMAADAGLGAT